MYLFVPVKLTRRPQYVLIRIVRMTFQPQSVDEFLLLFDDSSNLIRAFEGCHHLELWQDADQPYVFTTYSLWTDARALDAYRESDLFKSTWKRAKTLFAEPPEAHSQLRIREVVMKDSA